MNRFTKQDLGQYMVALTMGLMFFEVGLDIKFVKPYRMVGLLLVLFVALNRRLEVPRLFRTYIALQLYMVMLALVYILVGPGSLRVLLNDFAVVAINLLIAVAIYSVVRQNGLGKHFDTIVWACMVISALYVLRAPPTGVSGGEIGQRVYGLMKNPAYSAFGYAAMLNVLVVHRSFGIRRIRDYFLIGTTVICYLAVLMGGSRTGLIIYAVGIFLALSATIARLRIGKVGKALVYLLVVGSVVIPVGVDRYSTSVTHARVELKANDHDARYYLAMSGLKVAENSYYLGIGFAQYSVIHEKVFPGGRSQTEIQLAKGSMGLHDEFLQALVEGGALGLGVFLWFWFKLFQHVERGRIGEYGGLMWFVFFGGMVVAAFHFLGNALPFWSFLAVTLALQSRAEAFSAQPVAARLDASTPMRNGLGVLR